MTAYQDTVDTFVATAVAGTSGAGYTSNTPFAGCTAAISSVISGAGATVNLAADTSFLQSTKKYLNTTGNIRLPFANGSHEFEVGDILKGKTTGAYGTIVSWIVTSGSWGAGTAAGTVILKDVTGVFLA